MNDAFVRQPGKVNDRVPIGAAVENDRYVLHPFGLSQAERLKQLIERAVAAGKNYQRRSPQDEMKLAHGEVVKLKTKLGRDIRVGFLLVRQIDVEADAFGANFECAAIGGF